jgi:thymidine kinase
MYSGKSAELVRRVTLATIARLNVRVFRPRTDTRTAEEIVFSRNGTQVGARIVADVREMFRHMPREVEVVGLDEAQFFPDDLPDAVRELLSRGTRVIAAGLDLDFACRPFGPLPTLLAMADTVDKLTAVCMKCHSLYATRTQRLVNGQPASVDSPQVVVELQTTPETTYEARCAACYEPPASLSVQPSYWPDLD